MNSKTQELAGIIIGADSIELREVPKKVANEDVEKLSVENQPFLYASGNWGPGYVSIKGMVSHFDRMSVLVSDLAQKVKRRDCKVSFVGGNLTGGVIPGWMLSEYLASEMNTPVGFALIYGSRRSGDEATIVTVDKAAVSNACITLCDTVDHFVEHEKLRFDFVAGCAPSGMPLGFCLSQKLKVPFVYVRETRKKGGQKELITGSKNNPLIKPGCVGLVVGQTENFFDSSNNGAKILENEGYQGVSIAGMLDQYMPFSGSIIKKMTGITSDIHIPPQKGAFAMSNAAIDVEELINFSQTTVNSCRSLRKKGYEVNFAATILFYDNPRAKLLLVENGIEMIHVVKLRDILDLARKTGKFPTRAIDDYLDFLADPLGWQKERGLRQIEEGGTL